MTFIYIIGLAEVNLQRCVPLIALLQCQLAAKGSNNMYWSWNKIIRVCYQEVKSTRVRFD